MLASQYRSQHASSQSNVSSTPYATNSRINSYAAVSQSDQFPKKDQGIILESIDGIQLKDYIFAIGKIVGPVNILTG